MSETLTDSDFDRYLTVEPMPHGGFDTKGQALWFQAADDKPICLGLGQPVHIAELRALMCRHLAAVVKDLAAVVEGENG